MASFDLLGRFAADSNLNESVIHVLINNTGVSRYFKKEFTKGGIECQMQSNHFGHFLLTNLLLGNYFHVKLSKFENKNNCHFLFTVVIIRKADDSRIINVGSSNHSQCQHLDLVNIIFVKEGTGDKLLEIYNASKICNALFTRHLAQLIKGSGG